MSIDPISLLVTAALTAASSFLRPSQNVERGRVREIPLQSSEYGGMIPLLWGTIRVSGNVVWSTGLRQESETASVKGLGGPKVTTFTYFTDLAVMLTESKILDVIRIWADGKIIFDKTTGSASIPQAADLHFRLYTGSDDQEPDPLIVLDVDGKFGSGSTPAYRGRSYLVFENLNLTNFGNRIPNFSFEVVSDPEDGTLLQPMSVIVGQDAPDVGADGQFLKILDSSRGLLYITDNEEGTYNFNIVDLDTMSILSFIENGPPIQRVQLLPKQSVNYIERTNTIFGTGSTFSGFDNYFHTVDGTTFSVLSQNVLSSLNTARSSGGAASTSDGPIAFDALMFASDSIVPSKGIYIIKGDGTQFLDSLGNDLGDIVVGENIGFGAHIRTPVVSTGPNGKHAYILIGADSPPTFDQLLLYAVGVDSDDPQMTLLTSLNEFAVSPAPVTVFHGIRDVIVPSDLGLSEFGPSDSNKNIALAYDRETRALLIFAQDNAGNNRCAKWTREDGIVDIISVPFIPEPRQAAQSFISGTYAWTNNPPISPPAEAQTVKVVLLRVSEFAIDDNLDGVSSSSTLQSLDWGLLAFTQANHSIWDSARLSLYGRTVAGTQLYRISLASGEPLGVTLANIVEDISTEVGLESGSDLDVSELQDTIVEGYLLSDQQTARDAIQPLSDLYFFDGIETDYKLRFRDRGRNPSLTIEEDRFAVSGDDRRSYTQTRVQESEIPTSVQFRYIDNENDYQSGAQQSSRVLFPRATVRSDNQQTIGVPIACTADTAKQAAEKTLFTRWNEREAFEFRAGFEALVLDPADVVLLNLNNGRQARVRLESVDSGLDFSVEAKALQEQNNQYVSTVSGQTGNAIQISPVVSKPVEFFLIDSPLLRDNDSPPSSIPVLYWSSSLREGLVFPGAVLHDSEDLSTFSPVGATNSPASWGTLISPLSKPRSAYSWDRENSIQLRVARGFDSFESKTELEVLNGANALALISQEGEIEIIQFSTVSVVNSTSLSLENLLRGRRGTEPSIPEQHPSGTVVILLQSTTVRSYTDSVSEINKPHAYKCVAVGRTLEGTMSVLQTPIGRSLKPYSPVQLRATLVGADIILSAVRRTRIAGGLTDGTGTVPLNEESELYHLEILDSDASTVLRTITDLSSPSYQYENSSIIEDFGTMPQELTVVWYQLSSTVGRGFPGKQTLRIE